MATTLPGWPLALVVATAHFLTKHAVRLLQPAGTVVPVTGFCNFVSLRYAGAGFRMPAVAFTGLGTTAAAGLRPGII